MDPIFRDAEHQNLMEEHQEQYDEMMDGFFEGNDEVEEDIRQLQPNAQRQQAPVQTENPVKAHIRDMLARQKRMEADEPGQQEQQGHQAQENRQNQQNQQGGGQQQQNQQLARQIHQNIHQQLNNLSQNMGELLNVSAGAKSMSGRDLARVKPDFNKLLYVYNQTGFEYADSGEKRYKLLLEGEARYKLQGTLSDKIYNYDQALNHATPKNLSMEKAMSYSDNYLVDHYMEFGGDSANYLELRYNLMKNPFYSVLPVKQLKEMSRYSLLEKLKKESSKPENQQNQNLIIFYHDLIRLQTLETNEKRNKLRKNYVTAPDEMTAKERKNNQSYYKKNVVQLQKNYALSGDEKSERILAMHRVMVNDGNLFFEDKTKAERKYADANTTRGAAKQEGIRLILAWMYRNCNKSKASMEPLVFKLTQAHPAQLLHIFYLIEHDMATNPNAECFHSAIGTYIPDLSNFEKKANWERIGQAAGFVLKCDVAKEYLQLEAQEDELNERLDDERPGGPLQGDAKEEALLRLLLVKGKKLVNMYKAGGLDPNMSVELIQDNDLKSNIYRTVNEFNEAFKELSEVNKQALRQGGANEGGPEEGGPQAKLTEKIKNKESATKKQSYIDDTKKVSSAILGSGNSVIKLADAGFKGHTGYVMPMQGLTGILSAIGAISAIYSASKLSDSAATLSSLDYFSKQINIYSDIAKNMADFAKGVATIFTHFGEKGAKVINNTGWIGNTHIIPASKTCANIPGAVQFGAGVVTIGAGTVQVISSSIDLKQARQSKKHLQKANDALDAYDKQTEKMNEGVEKEKREYKKEQLKALFKDRNKVVANQNLSGAVKMAGGILTMGGGFLSTTGILAPIGSIMSLVGSAISIGFGMIYARIHRNKAIKEAVDEGLQMRMLMDKVKAAYNLQNLKGSELESLENAVRQEALAQLNYGTVRDCYWGMAKRISEMLYKNVLESPAAANTNEYKMYYHTLLSLRFKPEEVKRAKYGFEVHRPTLAQIYQRLTEGT